MTILQRLFGLKTSDDHALAGADISKEISVAASRAAELRGRIVTAPFEDPKFDIDAARRKIADAEDRVRALQDVANENERRRKLAADREAMLDLEQMMSEVRAQRTVLIDDLEAFAEAGERLVEVRNRAKRRIESIESANREANAAGRGDLTIELPIAALMRLTGRAPSGDPLEFVLPEVHPYRHPDGPLLKRIGEVR